KALQIADRRRGGEGRRESAHSLRHIIGRGTATQALFEQRHLTLEFYKLALVVGECLFGRRIRVLTDGTLALCLADVHRSVVVDAAPRGRLLVAHWSPAFASIESAASSPTHASLLQGHARNGGGNDRLAGSVGPEGLGVDARGGDLL